MTFLENVGIAEHGACCVYNPFIITRAGDLHRQSLPLHCLSDEGTWKLISSLVLDSTRMMLGGLIYHISVLGQMMETMVFHESF